MVEENLGKPRELTAEERAAEERLVRAISGKKGRSVSYGDVTLDELFGEPVEGFEEIKLAPLGDLEATIEEQVDTVLAGLTDRERFVLTRRFGISPDARVGLTLVETGRALAESVGRPRPYSERHIRRIEAGALFKLRGGLPAKSLHDYLEE